MARGAQSKEAIMTKILETFEGAFKYDKEIRIPMNEEGELVQIKVTLTCAKTNVESGDDTALPGAKVSAVNADNGGLAPATATSIMNEPTPEEKANVESLLKSLGLA